MMLQIILLLALEHRGRSCAQTCFSNWLAMLVCFRLFVRTIQMSLFPNEIHIARRLEKEEMEKGDLQVSVHSPEHKENGDLFKASELPLENAAVNVRQRSRSTASTEESVIT